jgi:hypothetical protein
MCVRSPCATSALAECRTTTRSARSRAPVHPEPGRLRRIPDETILWTMESGASGPMEVHSVRRPGETAATWTC